MFMEIKVNGKMVAAQSENMTLASFLEQNGFDAAKIVCAHNDNFIERQNFTELVLCDGDVLDIMTFVGGG